VPCRTARRQWRPGGAEMRPLAVVGCALGLAAGAGALGLRAGREEGEPEGEPEGEQPELEVCPQCEELRRGRCSIFAGDESWEEAAREEGLDPEKISIFGRVLPKIPRSKVERSFLSRNFTKTVRYTFMGSALNLHHPLGNAYRARRSWVLEFARQNFTDEDYMNIVDVPPGWVPLGAFDKSYNKPEDPIWQKLPQPQKRGATKTDEERAHSLLELGAEELGGEAGEARWENDDTYRQILAASRYTLCPGGDGPWSFRIFEAIAARSMPVIRSYQSDWLASASLQPCRYALQAVLEEVRRTYVTALPHVREADVLAATEDNWQTFLRYFTFMQGDNVPAGGLVPCQCRGEESVRCENRFCHPVT